MNLCRPPHIRRWCLAFIALGAGCTAANAAERINQEGRLLGPAPTITAPTLFNTAAADAVVSALQIMPVDSPWNEDVSRLPLLANSDAMIARILSDLGSSRQTLRPFYEMNYALVPDSQPVVAINFFNYPDESDPSPYPIPSNLPVEGWPRQTGALSLLQWQQDVNGDGGDRHAIMVKPGAGMIWETYATQLTNAGWQASNGAAFDLKSNTLRPAGWTSADAAGLPMFPALVRYDECERGMVEHALRLVVKHTRTGPLYPATHQASVPNTADPNVPAMGQRVRLKAGFVIPAAWTTEEKAVLLALKKYGALVADNGGFFSVSVCPDDRFSPTAFDHLSTVGVSNFEIVQATGPAGGPRSPGAPSVVAGPALTAQPTVAAALNGTVNAPAGTPLTVVWKVAAGPGTATFADASQASTSVTFSAVGTYTLLLSAADGVHAVAYDALPVNVQAGGNAEPPPAITSPPSASAPVGSPFMYQITASNMPAAFTAGGLPSGLSVDPATGLISGIPTDALQSYAVTLGATNAGGTGIETLMLTLTGASLPTVTLAVSGNAVAIEGGKSGKVVFARTGDTSAALTANYKIKGKAKAGVDYEPLPGAITIPAGALKAKLKIKAVSHPTADGPRMAKVKLLPGTESGYVLGDPSTVRIRIIDQN